MTDKSNNYYIQNNIHVHHYPEEDSADIQEDNTLDVIGAIFMGIATVAVPIIIALAQQPAPNQQKQRRNPEQKKIKNSKN